VGGMRPGAAGFEMTLKVRLMHAMVRQRLLRGDTWSTTQWGLPVNQLDMQATYLAFSVVHLIALQTTGMWLSRAQREAVMHLWRLIGWVMGVEEGLLCLSEAHGRKTLLHNMLTQAPADEGSVKLGRALMDEPLGRHYTGPLAAWAGPFNKARHLSLVRWFVGADGMRALGLPMAWPWYPLLCLAPLGARSAALLALPGLRDGVAAKERARQRHYLNAVMQGPTSAAAAHGQGGPGGAGRHQAS
jgi:ER-bound oxygenase mpaB/B'/Rubber oxygenase, catalytic domain